MTHQGIGEFEQMVLLAVAHLRDEAYAITIVDEIERRTGRSVARAAVYITLRRLEEKGFVSSWMGEPIAEREDRALDAIVGGDGVVERTDGLGVAVDRL